MSFSYPLALVGLLAIPYLYWLGRPRGTFSRNRERVSLAIRTLIVVLLVLGLAGLQVVKAADKLAVVFLIDASDSMSEGAHGAAIAYVEDVMGEMGPNDEAAVIVFGTDALVERPMSPVRELGSVDSIPLPLNTDLGEAIRLGLALYPPGSGRRMVILSDGLPTIGNAEEAARLAAASGVEIVAVPFSATLGPELLVTSVSAPTRLDEGQLFDLGVAIESSADTRATLRILGGGQLLHEETVALHEGTNRYVLPITAGQTGLTSFRVQIVPAEDDYFYQNNELAAFSQVTGPPRVLVVRQDEVDSEYLTEALLEAGLLVDQTSAAGVPFELASLSAYSSIVMVNVPASALSPRKMTALQTYVRDLGGGLVTVGGERTYGVGGYFRTPLEETLPVEMQLKEQERIPQLAMVFVIDKSGSMADSGAGGISKVELAKEAIIRSIQLLGPLDRVGVVSFDDQAAWVVELRSLEDVDAVANQVGTIRADGGTDIYDGLLAMSRELPEDPSTLKHVVLLTDGGADPSQIPGLVERLYEDDGITLSVVAIGEGYAPFLEDLPELAGGRFHFASDPSTIPEIFTEETVLATRAYIIEEPFTPTITGFNPIIEGISSTPPLQGYVGTSVKPAAQQVLATHHGDPLLAAWRYGLGRSVAWTSDATGRWAASWVGWENFPRFWSQAVRWTITEGVNQNVEVNVETEGESAVVAVDALDEDGNYLNGLELDAVLVRPGLESEPLTLRQVAPGRYEGDFEPDEAGAYFVRVAGAEDGDADEAQAALAQTTGWVLSYSPEYSAQQGDPSYLSYVAGLTGGELVSEPASIFAHNLSISNATQPIWPWLLLAVVVLLPFDIAVRRLVITRSDLARAWGYLRLGRKRRTVEEQPVRTSRVGRLFEAKERAQTTGAPRASRRAPEDVTQPAQPTASVRAQDAPSRPASPAEQPKKAEAPAESTLASRLLASKRSRETESESPEED
jgi:uncharacterized membrane protein